MSTICGVTLEYASYNSLTGGKLTGGVISPLITGITGGPFDGFAYYIYGGCPVVNSFDVLEKTGPGQYALAYPEYNSQQYYAGIFTDQTNVAGHPMRTIWTGHSFNYIRNSENSLPAANEFLKMSFVFFENGINVDISGDKIPARFKVEQNFPNPFNPSTRIRFTLPRRGLVSVGIYNVDGKLVRTLHDGVMDAGHHELVWDSRNNSGTDAASGVYFYKITACGDYQDVRKMVLLR
jgi:hypothetical protein